MDYRTDGHLAQNVRLTVGRRDTGERRLIFIMYTDLLKLIFHFYTLNKVTVHVLYHCRDCSSKATFVKDCMWLLVMGVKYSVCEFIVVRT